MIPFLNLHQKSALNLHCWTVWHKELVHVHCHLAAVVELTKFGSTRPTHYQLHQPNIDQTTKLVPNIITKLQQHSKWYNAANIPIFKVIKYITVAKPACQTLLKHFLCFFLWLGFSSTLLRPTRKISLMCLPDKHLNFKSLIHNLVTRVTHV